jgi:putative DNA primase/helicase
MSSISREFDPSKTTSDDQQKVVVGFPTTEEKARRTMQEARRLANLAPGEYKLWIARSAEQLGISQDDLEDVVKAQLKEKEKVEREKKAEDRRIESRAEKEQQQEEREEEREQQRLDREAERQQQREERQAEKEAEEKQKQKQKAFANLIKLPVARHEPGLVRLAERLGEELATLRQEFDEFMGVGSPPCEATEPWSEAVDIAALLKDLGDKISRYVVQPDYQLTATVLWAAHCWLYDDGVPVHSPILAATSAEPDTGKSTLLAVIGRAVPRYSHNVEMTGPSLYRFVDQRKPTLMIDEADDLFDRKSDLKHIINAGWTRGAKISRMAKIDGAWVSVEFDPFTPKAIALLGRNLPSALRSRCIELRMLPKLPREKVEPFSQLDDAEFAVLRRKLARFAADNAMTLKDAKPTNPSGFNNRIETNWKLLLAIAELAGGSWPQQAREAAERLSRNSRQPSDGLKLLSATRTMFVESGKKVMASKAIVAELLKNPTDIWVAFNHGGPITQRQVAHLFSAYDIHPGTVHPSGRSSDSPQGYKLVQFDETFARYLSADPHIHTLRSSKATKQKRKITKRRRKK